MMNTDNDVQVLTILQGYNVLSNALFETLTATWPDIAPENL
jgi:hypothetical protein